MLYRTDVYVNNYNLSLLTGVAIYDYNVIDTPVRNLNRSKLARSDKSILTSAEYAEKNITISGIVTGDSKDEIEGRYTTLNGIVQAFEAIIQVNYQGDDVMFTGTLASSSKYWFGKHLKFTFTFLCSDPFGISKVETNALSQTVTTSSEIYSISISGSYKALPVITVTVNSITGGTAKTVQIYNPSTGQGISVTRTYTANDILTIDSLEQTVDVNSTDVDYGGTFPSFLPGAREIQYVDDFTTRSVALSVNYKKRYA